MSKRKWHSKLVNLAVAFALVFSLAGIALLPVLADDGTTLSVTVSTPGYKYCCCDTFNVTATIENTGGVNATNVQPVSTGIVIDGYAEVTGGPSPAFGFNLTPGEEKDVEWTLHCTGIDDRTRITVTVTADNAPDASGFTEIEQESGNVQAFVVEPSSTDRIPACHCFNVTFYVENTGCSNVTTVHADLTPLFNAEIGCPPDPHPETISIGLEPEILEPGEKTEFYTVVFHCTDAGRGGVHIQPVATDICSDENGNPAEIIGDSANFEWDQVFGLTCDAEPNPTKVCHNVTFNATIGTGAQYPVNWVWNFGDESSDSGSTSESEFSVQHHYNSTGTVHACVNVTDLSGTTVQCCVDPDIDVYPALAVGCNATPNPTKVCHNVSFTAWRIGGIPEDPPDCSYTWEWDFGDTSPPVAAQNTTHHYGAPGNYTAEVTLTDDCGIEPPNVATCNVTVRVNPPLNVTCEADPLETKVCHNITFTGNITGGVGPYNWIWNFGDLNQTVGLLPGEGTVVAEHHYDEGTWMACFYVTDFLGNEGECCKEVIVHPPLSVNCTAEPEVSPVCHNVTFTATREGGVPGNPYSWLWVFGDGFTSTSQNVSRAYMCVGNYTATVTVTDELLGNTANCTANVTVIIEPPELISPILNAQLTSKNVTFEWEDIGCCNYTLEVWQKEEGGQKVLLVETGKDNTWTGPIFNGEWRWHVTATESCNISATSDTWFFRVDQPSTAVTVMSPNGGEVWQSGDSHAITWTAVPTDGVIDIYYSSDNGASWTLIKSGEVNDGAYPWTVPSLDSAQCLVRVVVTDAATGTAQDTSDGVFTITTDLTNPIVTVISPNGGESYAGGSTQAITWSASDTGGLATNPIDLYFSSNGGAEWAVIATGEANDGTYSWTVPGVESDQCLVKVEASDAAGNVGSDTSDAVFSITITEETPPSVTVKTPNGGETLVGGTNATITWKASDFWPTSGFGAADSDLTIAIYYSSDGGGSWTNEATGEANDGAYLWTVPDINSTQCLIRVDATDAAGNVGSDASDGVFTITTVAPPSDITAPTVTVTRPNGGETFVGGSQEFILWSASDDVTLQGDLTINLYYKVGSGSWIAIAAGEDNDGAYKWDVPEINSTQCLVRVDAVDEASNVGSDISDDEFAITIGVIVSVDAPLGVKSGNNFTANVDISEVTDFDAADFEVVFDSSVLEIVNLTSDVTNGQIDTTAVPVISAFEISSGRVRILVNVSGTPGVTGEGYLCQIKFHALGAAGMSSDIDLENGILSDNTGSAIGAGWTGASVNVLASILGDASGDGVLNAVDITTIEMMVGGLLAGTPEADANQDGKWNALDITLIEILVAGP